MLEMLGTKPFLVAFLAGGCAQFLKAMSFLIAERKLDYRRLVQADGMPNMHMATFTALSVAVGMKDGFDSMAFAFSLCLTAIVAVDTMNVKVATTKQAEVVWMLIDRIRKTDTSPSRMRGLSYTRLDVLSGFVLGAVLALIVL